ncbi:hypothetical protein Q31b_06680 [Novipirellula aureliae]|uniref:Uncharacterized protein n=1 Tax=Novipirellula aureliae TaxID=2527966 RepID=A0A5C6ED61_9BACT|nr:hypothetical protein Q31b_06680 [Novipirellula aureliae]
MVGYTALLQLSLRLRGCGFKPQSVSICGLKPQSHHYVYVAVASSRSLF